MMKTVKKLLVFGLAAMLLLSGCGSNKETVYIEPEKLLPLTEESYIRGSWKGQEYTNEKLGFTFTMPAGWVASSDKAMLKEMGIKPSMYKEDEQLLQAVAMRQIIYDFYIHDRVGAPGVWMLVDNLVQSESGPDIDLQTYADDHKKVLEENSPDTVIEEYTTMTVAGREFLVMPTSPKDGVFQWYLMAKQGDWVYNFVCTFQGDNGREKTIEFLNSIQAL